MLALHGLPTSPRLWERLVLPKDWTLDCPPIPGLGPGGTPPDWSLNGCVTQLAPQARQADLIVGHDLGGVLAAMLARPDQRVVLSGTALSLYWWAIRASALPVLHRAFYQRYGGRRFLSQGASPSHAESLLQAFGENGPDWPDRMRQIARAMQPPANLGRKLHPCKVQLVWGDQDPWYPKWVAQAVRRATQGDLHFLKSGHFAPWEDPAGFSAILQSSPFT